MGVKIRPKETRFLGWNAIQRASLSDWFRERAARTPTNSRPQDSRKSGQDSKRNENSKSGQAGENKSKGNESKSKNDDEKNKLEEVAEESHSVLAKARTVFPFTLFPDTITIDRHKLTIVHRAFFEIEQTAAVPIENIKNVEANHGPFFGSLTVTSDHFVNNTQTLNYLRRSDAETIQKLVQGAIVAFKESIDISGIPTKKLHELLIDLGEGHLSDNDDHS